jgi:predicted amidohydrolase YtcJ
MAALILHGGHVLTMDDECSRASAVAILDGGIAGVGERGELEHALEGAADCRDLQGATVVPGLIDTHPHRVHFGEIGEALKQRLPDLCPLADQNKSLRIAQAVGEGLRPGRGRSTPSPHARRASQTTPTTSACRSNHRELPPS